MGLDLGHAGRRARIELGVRSDLVNLGKAAGVVHLHVVGDHHIDLGGIDYLADAL